MPSAPIRVSVGNLLYAKWVTKNILLKTNYTYPSGIMENWFQDTLSLHDDVKIMNAQVSAIEWVVLAHNPHISSLPMYFTIFAKTCNI